MVNHRVATFHVYSRQGCHLCEVLIEQLMPLLRGKADVLIHDIDTRPDWSKKYDIRVPVLEIEGQVVSEFRLDYDAVSRALNRYTAPLHLAGDHSRGL